MGARSGREKRQRKTGLPRAIGTVDLGCFEVQS